MDEEQVVDKSEDPKPVVMHFGVPTFHAGFNMTVRKGEKWKELEFLQELELRSVDFPSKKIDQEISAYVQFTATFPCINAIPDFLMAMNHDSSARTYQGLGKAMSHAYELTEEELEFHSYEVTVIVFTVADNEDNGAYEFATHIIGANEQDAKIFASRIGVL